MEQVTTVYVCACGCEFIRFDRLERHIAMSVVNEPGEHYYDYSYDV